MFKKINCSDEREMRLVNKTNFRFNIILCSLWCIFLNCVLCDGFLWCVLCDVFSVMYFFELCSCDGFFWVFCDVFFWSVFSMIAFCDLCSLWCFFVICVLCDGFLWCVLCDVFSVMAFYDLRSLCWLLWYVFSDGCLWSVSFEMALHRFLFVICVLCDCFFSNKRLNWIW